MSRGFPWIGSERFFKLALVLCLSCANLCKSVDKEKIMSETERYFPGKRGVLCLTFDDRNFQYWLAAMPIFRKHGAKASFFIRGEINAEALEVIAALKADGHTRPMCPLFQSRAIASMPIPAWCCTTLRP